jgi:hypothetical protein
VAAVTIAYLLCGALPLTAQDDCKVLKKVGADALHKVHTTPTHVYTTTKINGQSFSSEIIYAAGSMYVKMKGKWTSGGSIEDTEETEQQLQHDANSNGTLLRQDMSSNGAIISSRYDYSNVKPPL